MEAIMSVQPLVAHGSSLTIMFPRFLVT
ncbi:hypothetical protein LINPERHAP1_LOCUS19050 [Linum perenne]